MLGLGCDGYGGGGVRVVWCGATRAENHQVLASLLFRVLTCLSKINHDCIKSNGWAKGLTH